MDFMSKIWAVLTKSYSSSNRADLLPSRRRHPARLGVRRLEERIVLDAGFSEAAGTLNLDGFNQDNGTSSELDVSQTTHDLQGNGVVDVYSFVLNNGNWNQGTLDTLDANDFEIDGSTLYIRGTALGQVGSVINAINIDGVGNELHTVEFAAADFGSASITVAAQEVDLTDTVSGTGDFTVLTTSVDDKINIGGAVDNINELDFSNSDISNLGSGWGSVNFGDGGNSQIIISETGATFNSGIGLLTFNSSSVGDGIQLNGNLSTDTASIEFNGSTLLNMNDVTITTSGMSATNGQVTFNGTVDGAQTLTINAGSGNITFVGAVGNNNPLGDVELNSAGTTRLNSTFEANSLETNAGGTTELNGNVTTSGNQAYGNDVVLTANVELKTTNDGDVTFNETLNGDFELTVDSGEGDVTFAGAVGDENAQTGPKGIEIIHAGIVTFDSTVWVGETGIEATSSGAININDDVTTTGGVTLTNGGLLTLADGIELNLGGAFTQSGVGAVLLGANITTAGAAVTFNGDVTLTKTVVNNLVEITTDNGKVTFSGTVNGQLAQDRQLKINSGTGDVTFEGEVGGDHALTSLEILGSGTIFLHKDISTTGIQSYGSQVQINEDITLTTTNSDVTFSGTVNSEDGQEHNLAVSAGTGTISFVGEVGSTLAGRLGDLETTTTGTGLTVLHNNVTTIGTQAYNGNVQLNDDVTLATTNSDVMFGGTVNSDSGETRDLTVNAGSGKITFDSTVGVTDALGDVELNSTGVTRLSAEFNSGSLTTDANGTTELNGNVTTTGNQTYGDDVILTSSVVLTTDLVNPTDEGNITFNGTLKSDNGQNHDLTINTSGTGNVEFNKDVGNPDRLGNITVNASGNITGNDIIFHVEDVADFTGLNISIGQGISGNFQADYLRFNILSGAGPSDGSVEITQMGPIIVIGSNSARTLKLASQMGSITDDDANATTITVTEDAQFSANGEILLANNTGDALDVGENASFMSTNGNITVGGDGSVSLGSVTFNSSGTVTITEDGDMVVTGTNTANVLTLTADGGSINGDNNAVTSITVTEEAQFIADGEIVLANNTGDVLSVGKNASFMSTNDDITVGGDGAVALGSVTFNSPGTVTITEDGDMVVTGTNTANVLTLTADGGSINGDNNAVTSITVTEEAQFIADDEILLANNIGDALDVGKNASFTSTNHDITVGGDGAVTLGSVTFDSPGAVSITEDDAMVITGTNNAGTLALTSGDTITDDAGTTIEVTDTGSFEAAGDLTLADAGGDDLSVGGNTSFTSTTGNITVGDGGAFQAGSLTFEADAVAPNGAVKIIQTGAMVLTGTNSARTLSLTSQTGSITDASATSITVDEGAQFSASGDIVLANTASDVLSVGDNASFTSTTSDITVGSAGSVTLGSVTFNSTETVTITEDGDMVVTGANTAGILNLTSKTGSITDASATSITVDEGAQFSANGNIVLANTAGDVLSVGGNASFTSTNNDITVGGAGAVTLGSVTFNSPGAVSITENDAMVITGANTAQTLSLTSGGTITDNAGTTIEVTDTASFQAAGDLTLADDATDELIVGNNASFKSNTGHISVGGDGLVTMESITFNAPGIVTIQVDDNVVISDSNTAGSLDFTSTKGIEITGTILAIPTGMQQGVPQNMTGNISILAEDGSLVVSDEVGRPAVAIQTSGAGEISLKAQKQNSNGTGDVVISRQIVNGTGDITITAAENLTVDGRGKVVSTSGDITATALNGSITIDSGNVVAIQTSADGEITLNAEQTTGDESHIVINSEIVSENGVITFTAFDNVKFRETGKVTSTSGNVTGTATNGAFVMLSGSEIDAGSGEIDLTAKGNVFLSSITTSNNTGDAVNVTSTEGAILGVDLGNGIPNIIATGANAITTLQAATGIGPKPAGFTLPGCFTDDSDIKSHLDVNVTNLNAEVTSTGHIDIHIQDGVSSTNLLDVRTNNGWINIEAVNRLVATSVVSETDHDANDITLTSQNGDIRVDLIQIGVDGSGATAGDVALIAEEGSVRRVWGSQENVIADVLTVRANEGVRLRTTVNEVNVENGESGDIRIRETDDVLISRLNQIESTGDVLFRTDDGSITIDNGSNTAINANGEGEIWISANGNEGDIIIRSAIQGENGDVYLGAEQDVKFEANGKTTTDEGDISIEAGRYLTMKAGTSIESDAGSIGLVANDDIILGRVQIGDDNAGIVGAISLNGSILGVDGTNIIANNSDAVTILIAANGIGAKPDGYVPPDGFTDGEIKDHLETRISNLLAIVIDEGDISIQEEDSIRLLSVGTVDGSINVHAQGTIRADLVVSETDHDDNDITLTSQNGDIRVDLIQIGVDGSGATAGDVTLIAEEGSVRRVWGSQENVIADVLTVRANEGVRLRTTVNEVNVENGESGEIRIRETDDVLITRLYQSESTGDVLFRTDDGSITIDNGNDTVVNANGEGEIWISANGNEGDIIVRSTIQSEDGDVVLNAGRDVKFEVDGSTTTDEGDILVTAGRYLTMKTGTSIESDNGSIFLGANDDVILGRVEISDDSEKGILVYSLNGAILGVDGTNIIANNPNAGAMLVAANGIGAKPPDGYVPPDGFIDGELKDHLETRISNLVAVVTDEGDISIQEEDSIRLLSVGTVDGSINVHAQGTIRADDVVSYTDHDDNDITLTSENGNIFVGTIQVGTNSSGAANGDVNLSAKNGYVRGIGFGWNVVGDVLTVRADEGVRLRTSVNEVNIENGASGDIEIRERNNVLISRLYQKESTGDILFSTRNGSITVDNGDDTVVNANGEGEIEIRANGNRRDIIVRSAIQGEDGDVFLNASRDVKFEANGSTTTDEGDILVTAGRHLTMKVGTGMESDTGRITLLANRDIILSQIATGNDTTRAVRIVSRNGAILGVDGTNIIANSTNARTTLIAANGIGVKPDSYVPPAGFTVSDIENPLETQISNLVATVRNTGDIAIQEWDDIRLSHVRTADGSISVEAMGTIHANRVISSTDHNDNDITLTSHTGNIHVNTIRVGSNNSGAVNGDVSLRAQWGSVLRVANSGNNIVADDLNVLAANGISLYTTVNDLVAQVTSTGDILIEEKDAINLASSDAKTDNEVIQTFNGKIQIRAAGDITIVDTDGSNDGGNRRGDEEIIAGGPNGRILLQAGNMEDLFDPNDPDKPITPANPANLIFQKYTQISAIGGATTNGAILLVATGNLVFDPMTSQITTRSGNNGGTVQNPIPQFYNPTENTLINLQETNNSFYKSGTFEILIGYDSSGNPVYGYDEGLDVHVDWGSSNTTRYEGPGFSNTGTSQQSGRDWQSTVELTHNYSISDIQSSRENGREFSTDPLEVRYSVTHDPSIMIFANGYDNYDKVVNPAKPDGGGIQLLTTSNFLSGTADTTKVNAGQLLRNALGTIQSENPVSAPNLTTAISEMAVPLPQPTLDTGTQQFRIPPIILPMGMFPVELALPTLGTPPVAETPVAYVLIAQQVVNSDSVPASSVVSREEYFQIKALSPDPNATDPLAPPERLPDDILAGDKLSQLFANLPDGQYEIEYALGEGNERSILKFDIRQGQPVVPEGGELDGGQLKLEDITELMKKAMESQDAAMNEGAIPDGPISAEVISVEQGETSSVSVSFSRIADQVGESAGLTGVDLNSSVPVNGVSSTEQDGQDGFVSLNESTEAIPVNGAIGPAAIGASALYQEVRRRRQESTGISATGRLMRRLKSLLNGQA